MAPRVLDYPSAGQPASRRIVYLCISIIVVGSCAASGILIGGKLLAPGSNRTKIANGEFASLEGAVSQFQVDTGRFPTTAEGLAALITPPPGIANWHGPYLLHFSKDRWGHPYIYRCPSKKYPEGFDIISMGPDGIEGTADDISNDVQDN